MDTSYGTHQFQQQDQCLNSNFSDAINQVSSQDQYFSGASDCRNNFLPQAQGAVQCTSMVETQRPQWYNERKSRDLSLGLSAPRANELQEAQNLPLSCFTDTSNGTHQFQQQDQCLNYNFSDAINQVSSQGQYFSGTSDCRNNFLPQAQGVVQCTSMVDTQQPQWYNESKSADTSLGNNTNQGWLSAPRANELQEAQNLPLSCFMDTSNGTHQFQPQDQCLNYIASNAINHVSAQDQYLNGASNCRNNILPQAQGLPQTSVVQRTSMVETQQPLWYNERKSRDIFLGLSAPRANELREAQNLPLSCFTDTSNGNQQCQQQDQCLKYIVSDAINHVSSQDQYLNGASDCRNNFPPQAQGLPQTSLSAPRENDLQEAQNLPLSCFTDTSNGNHQFQQQDHCLNYTFSDAIYQVSSQDPYLSGASDCRNNFLPQAQGLPQTSVLQHTPMVETQQPQWYNERKSRDLSLGNNTNQGRLSAPSAIELQEAQNLPPSYFMDTSNGTHQFQQQDQCLNSNFSDVINHVLSQDQYLSGASDCRNNFLPQAQEGQNLPLSCFMDTSNVNHQFQPQDQCLNYTVSDTINQVSSQDQYLSGASDCRNNFLPQPQGLPQTSVGQCTSMVETQQPQWYNESKRLSAPHANEPQEAQNLPLSCFTDTSNGKHQFQPQDECLNSNFSDDINPVSSQDQYFSGASDCRNNFLPQAQGESHTEDPCVLSYQVLNSPIPMAFIPPFSVEKAQNLPLSCFTDTSNGNHQFQPQDECLNSNFSNAINQVSSQDQYLSGASDCRNNFLPQAQVWLCYLISYFKDVVQRTLMVETQQRQWYDESQSTDLSLEYRAKNSKGQHLNNDPNGAFRHQSQPQARNSEVHHNNASKRRVPIDSLQFETQSQDPRIDSNDNRQVKARHNSQVLDPRVQPTPSVSNPLYGNAFNGNVQSQPVPSQGTSNRVSPTGSTELINLLDSMNSSVPEGSGPHNRISEHSSVEVNFSLGLNTDTFQKQSVPTMYHQVPTGGTPQDCSAPQRSATEPENSSGMMTINVPAFKIPVQTSMSLSECLKQVCKKFSSGCNLEVGLKSGDVVIETKRKAHANDDLPDGMMTINVPAFKIPVQKSMSLSECLKQVCKKFSSGCNLKVGLKSCDMVIETKREAHADDDFPDGMMTINVPAFKIPVQMSMSLSECLKQVCKKFSSSCNLEVGLKSGDMGIETNREAHADDDFPDDGAKERTSLFNHVQPPAKSFTQEELHQLMTAIEPYKGKQIIRWQKIQKCHFPNRSANELKEKFKALKKSSDVPAERRRGDEETNAILKRVSEFNQ